MYYTQHVNFRQDQPALGKRDANGWKTVNGYCNEARRLVCCLIRNDRYLHHHVRVSIDADLTEVEHRQLWAAISRKLRKAGVQGIWLRELNETGNRLHYHLLVATFHAALGETISNAVPPAYRSVTRVRVERVRDQRRIARYVTKAKVAGYDREHDRGVEDIYASKRRLFRKDCRLEKHGTIGAFWRRPRKAIWREVSEQERRIWSYRDRFIVEEAFRLYELVDGYKPLRRIERTLCYFAMLEDRRKCG